MLSHARRIMPDLTREQEYALDSSAVVPTIVKFGRGATALRQQLLEELEKYFPGLKFEQFMPGKPGRFWVSIDKQMFELTLDQVEVLVVGLRLGLAAGGRSQKLTAEALGKILTHRF